MHSVSSDIAGNARKNERVVLQALARVSQTQVAAALGISDSSITRFKDGQLEQYSSILAACGLKVVSGDRICVDREKFEAMATIARAALSCPDTSRRLIWDEE